MKGAAIFLLGGLVMSSQMAAADIPPYAHKRVVVSVRTEAGSPITQPIGTPALALPTFVVASEPAPQATRASILLRSIYELKAALLVIGRTPALNPADLAQLRSLIAAAEMPEASRETPLIEAVDALSRRYVASHAAGDQLDQLVTANALAIAWYAGRSAAKPAIITAVVESSAFSAMLKDALRAEAPPYVELFATRAALIDCQRNEAPRCAATRRYFQTRTDPFFVDRTTQFDLAAPARAALRNTEFVRITAHGQRSDRQFSRR